MSAAEVPRPTGAMLLVAPAAPDEVTGEAADGTRYRGIVDAATGLLLAPDVIHHHEGVVLGVGPRVDMGLKPGDRVIIQADKTTRWTTSAGLEVQAIRTVGRCERCGREARKLPVLAIVRAGELVAPPGRVVAEVLDVATPAGVLEVIGETGATEVLMVVSSADRCCEAGEHIVVARDAGIRWRDGAGRRIVSLTASRRCRCGQVQARGDILAGWSA